MSTAPSGELNTMGKLAKISSCIDGSKHELGLLIVVKEWNRPGSHVVSANAASTMNMLRGNE